MKIIVKWEEPSLVEGVDHIAVCTATFERASWIADDGGLVRIGLINESNPSIFDIRLVIPAHRLIGLELSEDE